jgi:CheY-like chemotaxis protein
VEHENVAEEKSILVVDDEDMVTWTISDGLSRDGGLSVETTRSAEEAVDILRKLQFDLVITDIRMEGMSGLELCTHIRTTYPDTLVMVITGYGSEELRKESLDRGAMAYYEKTTDLVAICRGVRDVLA